MRAMKTGISGFTLIEMMVVVAILGIVATIATPSFKDFIHDGRVTGATNEFISAVNYARSEAVRLGNKVELNAESGDFSKGWVIKDPNEPDATKAELRKHDALARVELCTDCDAAVLIPETFVFDRLGGVGADGIVFFRPEGCVSGSKNARRIEVNRMGRVVVSPLECP